MARPTAAPTGNGDGAVNRPGEYRARANRHWRQLKETSGIAGLRTLLFGRSDGLAHGAMTPLKRGDRTRRKWRGDRDSNPGDALTPNGFQDRRIRPLCHLPGCRGLAAVPGTGKISKPLFQSKSPGICRRFAAGFPDAPGPCIVTAISDHGRHDPGGAESAAATFGHGRSLGRS